MDENLQACLDKLTEALSFTREPVKRIRYARDWYKPKPDGREYVKEVAEVEFETGKKIYADIGCDSNAAALYDIMATIIGEKDQSSLIQRLEYPEEGGTET